MKVRWMYFWFFLLFSLSSICLCSCSRSPITFFNSFTRYHSEDGVMILECQLHERSGVGKLKINDECKMFEWDYDWNGYRLWTKTEDDISLAFSIDFPDKNGLFHSKSELNITRDHLYQDENVFPELTNWSSVIVKEKELSDEEIDARYCKGVHFVSQDLNLDFRFEKIGVLVDDRKYSIILNEDKTFYLKRDYSKRGEGTYKTTKEYLYLTFERDDLFNSLGLTRPFKMVGTSN